VDERTTEVGVEGRPKFPIAFSTTDSDTLYGRGSEDKNIPSVIMNAPEIPSKPFGDEEVSGNTAGEMAMR
jgi:hypothetical protein